jgi:hypothetical protein
MVDSTPGEQSTNTAECTTSATVHVVAMLLQECSLHWCWSAYPLASPVHLEDQPLELQPAARQDNTGGLVRYIHRKGGGASNVGNALSTVVSRIPQCAGLPYHHELLPTRGYAAAAVGAVDVCPQCCCFPHQALTELRVFMCMNRLTQVSSSSIPDMDFCST